MKTLCLATLFLLFSACLAVAEKSAITGTVTDPTGAVIANAKVRVHWDSITSQTKPPAGWLDVRVKANEVGMYEVEVPPGFYDISISSFGFKPAAAKLRVQEGQHTKFDASLALDPRAMMDPGPCGWDCDALLNVIQPIPASIPDRIVPTPQSCAAFEHVKPNLHVPATVQLSGNVKDASGAPFKNTRVELRRIISDTKQETIRVSTTNTDGNFSLGEIPKGHYRLLASPTRAFAQPQETWCRSRKPCILELTLKANPTDLPESQCPIR